MPVTDDTVSVVWLLLGKLDMVCRHTTVVLLAHELVLHSAAAIAAVGVASRDAKLRPLMVAEAPPLVGALPLLTKFQEMTGATMRKKVRSRCYISKLQTLSEKAT